MTQELVLSSRWRRDISSARHPFEVVKLKTRIDKKRRELGLSGLKQHAEYAPLEFKGLVRPLEETAAKVERAVEGLSSTVRNEGLHDIRVLRRGAGTLESNYRLLGEKLKLVTRARPQYVIPDGDGYEVVGVSPNPLVEVLVPQRKERPEVRMRLGRKQRAARAYIPKETIKIIQKTPAPAPVEVVQVRVQGLKDIDALRERAEESWTNRGLELIRPSYLKQEVAHIWLGVQADVKVKFLEVKIKALLGIINAPKVAVKRKQDSIARLQELWNVRKKLRAVK
jgi:hypothetical protein